MRVTWIVSILITCLLANAGAQTAILVGTTARDSSDHRLAGVDISIPDLRRSTTSNYVGEFRMDGLAAGRFAVVVRRVGFAPLLDTVDLKSDAQTLRDFVLAPTAVTLDSVRVVAAERKYISPALRGFEERRKEGFGFFFGDSLLRLFDSDKLASIVRRIPGLNLVPYRASMYAGSQRGGSSMVLADPTDRKSPRGCWAALYLDGLLMYSLALGQRGTAAPDFNSISLSELAGVEYYHGGATIPVQFNTSGAGCGTLLLWTRER